MCVYLLVVFLILCWFCGWFSGYWFVSAFCFFMVDHGGISHMLFIAKFGQSQSET